ncbi:MAG TPA: hypothetical protein VF549_14615 [Solirubrobacteraceae bacterium]|jgi:hypothetical protein
MADPTLFTLEVIQAEQGDSLILHYGSAADPQTILIDGGPSGVYERRLKARLAQLGPADGKVFLPLVMVSHIDDDHIVGILELFKDLDAGDAPAELDMLWHNAFHRLVPEEAQAKVKPDALGHTASLVVASAAKGRELDDLAEKLVVGRNEPFGDLVRADKGGTTVTYDPGLKLTVLSPFQEELDALEKEWRHTLKDDDAEAKVTAYTDTSVANLSSIVVLAECGGRRMLLPGDARGDAVERGIESAGLKFTYDEPLDIFKLPHHGSIRNAEASLFEKAPARHYVISANGMFDNPDIETLEMLSKARKGHDDFTIWFTNRDMRKGVGEKVAQFLEREKKAGRKYETVFREDPAVSLFLDLLDDKAPRPA